MAWCTGIAGTRILQKHAPSHRTARWTKVDFWKMEAWLNSHLSNPQPAGPAYLSLGWWAHKCNGLPGSVHGVGENGHKSLLPGPCGIRVTRGKQNLNFHNNDRSLTGTGTSYCPSLCLRLCGRLSCPSPVSSKTCLHCMIDFLSTI